MELSRNIHQGTEGLGVVIIYGRGAVEFFKFHLDGGPGPPWSLNKYSLKVSRINSPGKHFSLNLPNYMDSPLMRFILGWSTGYY